MPNITQLRKTIAHYLGQALTPEMAAEIEVSAYHSEDEALPPSQFGCIQHGGFTIQVERLSNIIPEIDVLHAAHWLETEKYRHGLQLNLNYPALMADERAGRLMQFTVRNAQGALVGNLRMYVAMSRHTQTMMAREDTLYLTPEVRGSFLPVALMRFAEKALLSLGVREIEGDSKLVNNADVLMRRLKYTAVAIKFSKVFGEKHV
jgi:hypothetical protein